MPAICGEPVFATPRPIFKRFAVLDTLVIGYKHANPLAPSLVHGGRRERVKALGAIGVRFALGAFIVATLVPYIDPYIKGDLSNGLTAAIGGAVIALVASCVKTA